MYGQTTTEAEKRDPGNEVDVRTDGRSMKTKISRIDILFNHSSSFDSITINYYSYNCSYERSRPQVALVVVLRQKLAK